MFLRVCVDIVRDVDTMISTLSLVGVHANPTNSARPNRDRILPGLFPFDLGLVSWLIGSLSGRWQLNGLG